MLLIFLYWFRKALTKLIFENSAVFSMWARTNVVISGNGAATGLSFGVFGFEGNLPLLPLRLSERTTVDKIINKTCDN